MKKTIVLVGFLFLLAFNGNAQKSIIHDAEYNILFAQNGDKWAADDKEIDAKLKEIKKKNGNQPVGNNM